LGGDDMLWLTLDGTGALYLQVYRAMRKAILEGKLAPGAGLPSTRALADALGVSRNTVILAYGQLQAEGYITTRHASGTSVAAELPDQSASVAGNGTPLVPQAHVPLVHLSPYAQRLLAAGGPRGIVWGFRRRGLPYDFRYGEPAYEDVPLATWCRLLERRARRASMHDLAYGPPEGAMDLRQAICEYLQRARGVVCTPERLLIVAGSQQALDLTARVLIAPGERVLLEEPHYRGAAVVFQAAGAELEPVPVDADGLRVAELRAPGKSGRLIYVTPSHQFPTGGVMPLARRLELLAWAERANAFIFEDDYDSEYRYTGRPVEALQGLDRHGRVIYAGTFSKLLFPALRLGYLVLPESLVRPFTMAKAVADTGSPTFEQRVLADFIRAGHFEWHLRRSRTRNAARRTTTLEAIERYCGDRVEVSGANAGLHVLLWLPGRRTSEIGALLARAAAVGVGVYSIVPYYLKPPQTAGLLLGYASLTEEQIRQGIQRLASVIR
jgi:GntR family transcriptional regulator / MocR family aminotransferase